MEVQNDFRKLLELFNTHKVAYIIVGAYALAYHGAPRYTGDIDILVHPDSKNARRIIDALNEFGLSSLNLTVDDFVFPGKVVQLGVAPVRVDIVTSITGVSWKQASISRVKGKYGDVAVSYIGKKDFIRNKRALGRKKDLADLEALGKE
ncbi:MAG: hypothetical protein V1709_08895 [Planctomycetota bacterium]